MSTFNPTSTGWWGGIALAVAVAFSAGYAADFVGTSLLGFERSPVSDIMMAIIIAITALPHVIVQQFWEVIRLAQRTS